MNKSLLSFCVVLAFLASAYAVFNDAEERIIVGRLVNVRSGPGRSYSIVGQLSNGQPVKYVATEGSWTKIGEMAYVPSIYALPKSRVQFTQNGATAKPLAIMASLVNPVYQTSTINGITSTTQLEMPVNAQATVTTSTVSRTNPNKVATTTALKELENGVSNKVIAQSNNIASTLTSTSANTQAGSTLLSLLQSKPVDTSALKTYSSVHVKAKTTVDTLNNVEAFYDTSSKHETEYTCDEFVKRYYLSTKKLNVVLSQGKPVEGFSVTLKPTVGDLAVNEKHRAIVKQVVGDVVVLIEQNYKWADKKKSGYRASKNRRLTIRSGVGIDELGNRYVFYTPK